MVSIDERAPTVGEFRALASAVGWEDKFDWETMQAALDASLVAVVATDDGGGVVGAGRLVGDGVRYFYVQDVIVHPDAADDGLATRIVEQLVTWTEARAGDHGVVGLFASPAAVGVYTSLAFAAATDDPLGMTLDTGRDRS